MARILRAPAQCTALAKSGKRCGITSECSMKDANGNLVCQPLRNGGKRCSFHLEIFSRCPARVVDPIVFYLDFETSGLSVTRDHIVEIGVLEHTTEAIYSTVVCPPTFPATTETPVHGIAEDELKQGPDFHEAFRRMVAFVEACAAMSVRDMSDSSDDEFAAVALLKESPPSIVIIAHNGFKFDMPILLSSCWRGGISLMALEKWAFADSLDIARAVDFDHGGCVKLQCLFHYLHGHDRRLQAHRALDDCRALRMVLNTLAEVLGVDARDIVRRFAVGIDICATSAELNVLH